MQKAVNAQDVQLFTLGIMHGPCVSLATHGRRAAPDNSLKHVDNAHPPTLVHTILYRRRHSQSWRRGAYSYSAPVYEFSLRSVHLRSLLNAYVRAHRTQEMGGDPMGMLLRQRIVFLGGEVRTRTATHQY